METKEICRRLNTIKTILGLDQSQLAHKLGITQQAVSKYLKDRVPNWEVIVKFVNLANEAGETEITLDWIITGKKQPPVDQKKVAEKDTGYIAGKERQKIDYINKIIALSPFHRNLFYEHLQKGKNRTIFEKLDQLSEEQVEAIINLIDKLNPR